MSRYSREAGNPAGDLPNLSGRTNPLKLQLACAVEFAVADELKLSGRQPKTSMHDAMEQLKGLPIGERPELVQDLWDSIAESEAARPVEDWQ